MLKFPDGFLWGTATSAYQIEGARRGRQRPVDLGHVHPHAGGRGKIERDENGDVACDHYHRYREDVAIMGELGLNAYRFSIAWARVLPQGTGASNLKGLDFYNRLVDALLERNIRPFVTLYHWDLPQALEDRGGWGSRDTAAAFGEYAALMGRTLGDRVKDWITLNEPLSTTAAGYIFGMHPPGQQDVESGFPGLASSQPGARARGAGVARDRAAVTCRHHTGVAAGVPGERFAGGPLPPPGATTAS